MRHAAHALSLAAVLALLSAQGASAAAAERFAAPSGRGAVCSEVAPCEIKKAVNEAEAGQTVTLEPGTYGASTPLPKALTIAAGVTVHGRVGQPRPVLITEALSGIILEGEGSSVSDIEVQDATGEYGIFAESTAAGPIDHVISHVSAAGAVACEPSQSITDSVCWSSGPNGVAASLGETANATTTLRNDTLIASASGGEALAVHAKLSAAITVSLTNTIAHGAAFDIAAATKTGKPSVVIDAEHSDYATVHEEAGGQGTISVTAPGTAANQTGAPVFVDEAAGEFRESASSSATLGEGLDSPLNGATDLEGAPRELFGATDIGAYQFIPPPSCFGVSATASFAQPVTVQLSCVDLGGAPLTYAIGAGPAHGALSLSTATGQAVYTPAIGFSGTDSFTYSASSRDGTATTATAAITVNPLGYRPTLLLKRFGAPGGSVLAPTITSLSESARRWREGNSLAALSAATTAKKPPRGTTFAFTLNEAATITFAFTRQLNGRKVARRCVPATNKNAHAHRCTRTLTAGALVLAARAGINKLRFDGLITRRKRLAAGSYTVLVTAATAGKRSATSALHFTIAPAAGATPAAAAAAAAASVSAAATHIVEVAPVEPNYQPKASLHTIAGGSAGNCSAGSDSAGNAYRCFAGNGVYDPCWADDGDGATPAVICQGRPWETSATTLTLTQGGLEPFPSAPPSIDQSEPWGVQLSTGERCLAAQGAHTTLDRGRRVVDYSCEQPGRRVDYRVLVRGIDRAHGSWTIRSAAYSPSAHRYKLGPVVTIVTAWYARPDDSDALAAAANTCSVGAVAYAAQAYETAHGDPNGSLPEITGQACAAGFAIARFSQTVPPPGYQASLALHATASGWAVSGSDDRIEPGQFGIPEAAYAQITAALSSQHSSERVAF
jgi:Bacterial Ig domain